MTVIDIIRKPNSFTVVAAGHANAPRTEDGRDLVCCAISTLMCTLANSCAQIKGPSTMYHTQTGLAELTVTNIMTAPDEVRPRLQMLIDGFSVLEAQYPQNLRMTIED